MIKTRSNIFRSIWLSPLVVFTALMAAIAVPCRADTIVAIDLSNVTFTGNNSCGTACKDVFNATWDWDATTQSIVSGTLNVNNSGVLGSMSLYAVTSYSFQFNSTTLLPDYDSITWYFGGSFPATGTYTVSQEYMYCGGGVCATDFGSGYSDPKSGTITVSPVNSPVPEPSSISLLGLGILTLASRAWRKAHATWFGFLGLWASAVSLVTSPSLLLNRTKSGYGRGPVL